MKHVLIHIDEEAAEQYTDAIINQPRAIQNTPEFAGDLLALVVLNAIRSGLNEAKIEKPGWDKI